MRKIKSVKLKDNKLSRSANGVYLTVPSYDEFYIRNHEEEFEIEYEPEGFELKRYTEYGFLDYDSFMKRELNRLADWCDGQNKKDLPREYFVEYDDIILLTDWTHDQYFRHGLKFNSCQSANLFITEINKPENSDYKKYFIELLKKTRL